MSLESQSPQDAAIQVLSGLRGARTALQRIQAQTRAREPGGSRTTSVQSPKDPMPSTDTGRCWSVLSSCRNGGGEGQGSGSQLTGHTVDGFEGPQDAHGADGRQVDVLKVQRVLDHPAEKGGRVRDTAGGTLRAHLCPQLPRGERHPGSESLLWPTQLCGLGCHLFCKGTWWHLPPTALGIPVNAVGGRANGGALGPH